MSFIILSTSTTRAEHQHMMCGALAPQKQASITVYLLNSVTQRLPSLSLTKRANVLTPITPFHSLTPSRKHNYYFQHIW